MLRVLKPGGRFVIAGEPTRSATGTPARLGRRDLGGRHARSPTCRRCASVGPAAGGARRVVAGGRAGGGRRPAHVRPATSWPRTAMRAGAVDVRTVTEELTAALLGWPVRTFEAAVQPGAARLGLGDVRLPAPGSGCPRLDRVAGAGRARSAVLQRLHHRTTRAEAGGADGRPARGTAAPARGGLRPSGGACAGWLRHRAWTPYYLVRYWRFLRLRAAQPAGRSPRASSSSAAESRSTARPGYGRMVIGSWVHFGDRDRLRAHEGTLRIGDKAVFGRDNTVNCYLDIEIGARAATSPTGSTSATSTTSRRPRTCPIKDQGIVKSPVRIGADVWLGTKATVLRGTDIGAGLGRGGERRGPGGLPPRSVVGGVPAPAARFAQAPQRDRRASRWSGRPARGTSGRREPAPRLRRGRRWRRPPSTSWASPWKSAAVPAARRRA